MKSSAGHANSGARSPLGDLFALRRPVILDGAMGTELQRRGIETGLPLWSANALLSSPETVRQIHVDYVRAGADIITSNTFRTTRRTFRRAGLPDRSARLSDLAVSLAKEARAGYPDRPLMIAGSMAPLEDCYHPELVPPQPELREEHAENAQRLTEAGVDFLLLETMGTIREALAAAEAARATGKEFVASFLCNAHGSLYDGESLQDAVYAIAPLLPSAFSINCVSPRSMELPLKNMLLAVRNLSGTHVVPLAVYANVGVPGGEHGDELIPDVGPDEYGECARRWVRKGVAIIGGCCGTTPEHITAVKRALRTIVL